MQNISLQPLNTKLEISTDFAE